MPPTQAEVAETRRAEIESVHNAERDEIEKTFVTQKQEAEDFYREQLANNARSKREAFLAEGLNSDGSDPQGRTQG